MDHSLLLKGERSQTLFQITYWAYFAFIHIFLLNFLLRSQWLIILFRKAFIFHAKKPNHFTSPSKTDEEHETALCLRNMVEIDGAGAWPPRTSFGASWPAVLQPYHNIYLEVNIYLSCAQVSLDDQENMGKIQSFRERMQKLLQEQIDLPAVEAILSALESGDNKVLPLQDLNGLYACIAMSRHAFRY